MGDYIFKMPDIGEGVVEAEITQWHVKVGDSVKEDAPIADAMTDKATVELTAPVSGIIKSIGCAAGDVLAIGAALAVFETDGDSTQTQTQAQAQAPTQAKEPQHKTKQPAPETLPKPQTTPPPQTPTPPPVSHAAGAKVLASPAVRKRARNLGIDLGTVTPSGALGHITHTDLDQVLRAEPRQDLSSLASSSQNADQDAPVTNLEQAPLQDGESRTKIIGLRRLIAQRMAESKRNLAHFTYVDDIDVTDLEALRKRINSRLADGEKRITVLPFIIVALTRALKKWPQMNAHYMDNAGYLATFSPVHLGIATQTDLGLVVPVLRNADMLGVHEIATEIARLSTAARSNTLSKDELSGATTTITSLGPLGGLVTTPVINRPQTAIFGPNKIRKTLMMSAGVPAERLTMNFSISCDHRIIDGYDAAMMVQYIKGLLEDPMQIALDL